MCVVILGQLQAAFDQIDIFFRGCDATLRLLLENVQHVDGGREAHRIDSAKRITCMASDNFKNARASKALENLGVCVLVAALRCAT